MNITYLVLIIIMAFNFIIFLYFRWYIKQRTSSAGLFRELQKHQTEVDMLIADIDAVTDRNLTLVEDNIGRLKEILDETDKRISVYVKELEKSRTGEALYTQLGRGIRAALNTEAAQVAPELTVLAEQHKPVKASTVAHEHTFAEQSSRAVPQETSQETPLKPPSKRQIRAQIDLLADEGLPPEEIASRLDISIAQVDLAMQLRRRNR